jgi:hypothetical protein
MTHKSKPHLLNVPGDFYVEDGCCTACDVPRTEAPGLFGMISKPLHHCYVKRQPQTAKEHDQILSAIRFAEMECIHYCGTDQAIISRLSAMGQLHVCDTTPPPDAELGFRTHITFVASKTPDLSSLASSFKSLLNREQGEYSQITFPSRFISALYSFASLFKSFVNRRQGKYSQSSAPSRYISATSVTYKWNNYQWCNVTFERHEDYVHVFHDESKINYATWHIERWLTTCDDLTDVRFYTEDGWHNTEIWHHSSY